MTQQTYNEKDFKCIICDSQKFKFIFSDFDNYVNSNNKKFSLFKCENCELIEIYPKISEEEFNIYYPKEYNPYNVNNESSNISKYTIKNLRDFIIKFFKIDKLKLELEKYKNYNAKYLDFGCGSGRNLNHINSEFSQWKLYGYDKSQYVKNKIIKCNFEFLDNLENLPNDYFDIINLSSVIEHLKFPLDDINLLKKKLKKGGLIIIKTPNWKSLGRMIFRKNWLNYDIPRHIYVFSANNLQKLLSNKNFKIIKLIYSNNIGVELKSLYRFLKLKKRPKYHNFLTKLFLPIGIFLNLISLSSTITVIGKKID